MIEQMGREAQCTCRWDKRTSEGKALLETDYILFRGEFRLQIPFKEMKSVRVDKDELRISHAQGNIALCLGPAAQKWAEKILNPPTRIDKLGVKANSRVCLIDLHDAEFEKELEKAKAEIVPARSKASADLVFLGAEEPAALRKIKSSESLIKPDGAVWVVYPKGVKVITEMDVLNAGREAGLKDVKVMRFSDRMTGLKFVIPISRRR